MEEKQYDKKSGNLILENRHALTVSAIKDIESFSQEKIVFITSDGTLSVTGSDMRVKKLSAESGEAFVEGKIDGCIYHDGKKEKESFIKKVLK